MEGLTEYEEKGVEAIQYMQKMNGVEESREKALASWRKMSASDKALTRHLYQQFKALERKKN